MTTRGGLLLQGIMLFMLALLLAACGGGGGDARTNGVVDPASSYTGVTTQATVSQANAEELAMSGFAGGSVAETIGGISLSGKVVADQPAAQRPVLQMAQLLKQSVRRMDLPGTAIQERQAKTTAGAAKTVRRSVTHQTPGDAGGMVTYTLEVNDATGSFYGTLDFQGYTSQGITVSGKAEMLGTFDPTGQQLSRLTLSFTALTMAGSSYSSTLVGTLSWGFNPTAATENLSINMVLVDNSDSRSYWFKNYELTTTYASGYLTQSLTGSYYDPVHGYVTFTTQTPLVAYTGNDWPSQGALLFTGQQGTAVRLSFSADTLLIEADTDGNGSSDWQTEQQTNIIPAVNVPPVANAGPDQTVTQWTRVTLDGSASSDANNDPLTYSWVSSPSRRTATRHSPEPPPPPPPSRPSRPVPTSSGCRSTTVRVTAPRTR